MKKVFTLLIALLFATASSWATVRNVPGDHPNIQAAVAAAVSGDEIKIAAGTFPIGSTIVINVPNLTITGAGVGSTIISTDLTAGTNVFQVLASDFKLQNVEISKTDKAGVQNLIWINANNASILNNSIHGQFVIGEGDVSRAMVVSGGLSGLLIDGNTFYALRQPLYVTGTTTGNVSNNLTYGTKGWVLEGGNLTFTGNTWGVNVYDIAIIPSMPAIYYTDIVAMSNANNGAVIEDQRVSPAVLSVAHVVASTSYSGDMGGTYHPYSTITPAITRVVPGGTIKVAAGTYTEAVTVNKSVTILGPNADISPVTGTRVAEAIIVNTATGRAFSIQSGNTDIIIKGFKFDGGSPMHDGNDTNNPKTSDVTFTNNWVVNSNAIFAGTNSSWNNVEISNNKFQEVNAAADASALSLRNTNSATVTGNMFTNINYAAILIDGIPTVNVSGNTINGTGFQAIQLANAIGNATVENNIINNANQTAHAEDRGAIRLYGSAFTGAVLITNNTVAGGYNGIAVRNGENITGKNITITGNSITNLNGGKAIYHGGTGTLNATCNWFGTTVETQVANAIGGSGPVNYTPFNVSEGGACLGGIPATTVVAIIGAPSSTTCGTWDVPVTVKNFNNIGSISLRLTYDVTKLQLKAIPEAAGPWPGVTINPVIASLAVPNGNVPGTFTLGYYIGKDDLEVELPDNAVLFTLHFTKVPLSTGTTSLTWMDEPNTGNCEFSAKNGTVYSSIFNDEQVIDIPTWPVKNIDTGLDYCTIQDAIDATETLDGHTITVADGTYPENLNVYKSLNIRGANYGISAGYTPGGRGSESVIVGQAVVSADGVTFDGLEFDSPVAAETKLVQPSVAGLTIHFWNNVFDMKNQVSSAIYNDNKASTTFDILNNKFKNQFYASSYSSRVIYAKNTYCTITGNDFEAIQHGLYLVGSSTDATTVSGNRFSLSGMSVLIGERQNIQIINNDFVSGGGIYCDKTSNLTISNNNFGTGVSYAGWFTATIGSGINMYNNSILSGYTTGTDAGKTLFNFSSTQTVTAKCNWWGTTDPVAIAAKKSGTVNFTPWLLDGTDASTNPGFQPNVGCDETPPALTCPADVTVNQRADKDPYATGYATTTDPADVITYNDSRAGLILCNATGVIVRTWTATDLAGNKSTCVQNITVEDVDNPVVVVPADITVNNDPGACTAVVTYPNPTATDFGHFQGFENPLWVAGPAATMPSTDWNEYQSPIVRVATGTNGISSKSGDAHAVITPGTVATGIFSRLGGFYNSFGNGFVTSVDVYLDVLDPKVGNSTYGWDVSTAAYKQNLTHLRDFIFHAAGEPGKIVIAASNNSNGARRGDLASVNHYDVTTSDWYTLRWTFRNNSGELAVDCQLLSAAGTVLWTETRTTPTDLIASVVGGNGYMWFTFLAADKLAIDNTTLTRNLAVTPASLSGTAFAKGTTTVSATAVDACGKTTTSSFTVTVVDNEAPVITGPADIAIECNTSINPSVTGEPMVADNCPGTPAVEYSDDNLVYLSSDPNPASFEINAQSRWGASGQESILKTFGNADVNINSGGGAPDWDLNEDHDVKLTYDYLTGTITWQIDFNRDGDFLDAVETTSIVSTGVIGKGFKYVNIYLQGNNTTTPGALLVKDLTVNGTNLGTFSSLANQQVIEKLYQNSAGQFTNLTITAKLQFTQVGTNQERPRLWIRAGDPVTTPDEPICAANKIINRVWTATDANGNKSMKIQKITVSDNTKPVFTATTLDPVTVHVNNTVCTYDGVIALPAVTDNCSAIIDLKNNKPDGGWPVGEHIITWTATDECGNFETKAQTVTVVKNKVSGKMVYYNAAETPMGNVTMELYEGAVLKGTATTSIVSGNVGKFEFTDLCNGTYKVVVTDNKKETGFINNTDAILVNSWSAYFGQIEHVKFLAGDVALSDNSITSADALRIQRHYVFGELFVGREWSYWKQGAKINNNSDPYPSTGPWPTDITVTVNGNDATLDLYAMGTGDFNGSFTPNMLKSANPSLILTENSNLQVGANQAFELPMVAASAMQVSAVSMSLLIPSNLVEVQDVVMKNSETPVVWAVKGNELRIGWYSLDPVNVDENGSLLTLRLKTSNAFTAGQSLDISLPFDPLNELADGRYKAMESAELMVAKVGNQTVGNIAIDKNGGLLFSNYPNPFNKVTMLEYSLPVDGKVTINLFNNLGQLVSVLVDADQPAGQHTFRYETNILQPGIYVAKLRLVNSETDMVGTIKLSVHK